MGPCGDCIPKKAQVYSGAMLFFDEFLEIMYP
jgi:hypothetical protein